MGATSPASEAKKVAVKRGAGRSEAEWDSDSPENPLKHASARSSRPLAGTTRAPAAARKEGKIEVTREPRSAFTVAKVDERIEDVALRVYGTIDESDSLWRANRDTLPRKDSPLLPGMLLRTPAQTALRK
jgi:hypothetical protein